ncbi:unnamed protein product [Eruca vesicaria subsp. sativa]|uniref:Uncharacterized protein n=1 Tax=Eruca vesicaria subsp. sativa TaxID=29727 RepID=A0ABC8M5W2_ERUVS|nr:unnamed protein product [Eruca vesicaria subsp. sativa]
MQKPSQRTPETHSDSFTIHINEPSNHHRYHNYNNKTFIGFSSSMKIFSKFRKIFMKIIFTLPSSSSSATRRRRNPADSCSGVERLETPKISCSNSYYSSHSHYSEAISDCIDFFNKSSINNNNNNMSHHEREDQIVHDQNCFYV